jgi:DNA-binding NarL/FixJ family response regulator
MAEPLSNQEIQEEVASQEIQEQSPRGESQEQTHSQEIQEEIPSRKIHVDVVTANRQEKVLLLHQARFNQRDIEIFQSILEGNKYEYIAGEQGISLSSVKKRVRFLLNHLNLPDKASFVFT